MSSLFTQIGLFFGIRGDAAVSSPKAAIKTVVKSKTQKKRDPLLEERASWFLLPVAPELCGVVTVGWNLRMRTTAGVAIATRREIWLNPALRSISEEEVERTLLHEIAHLLAQHRHGRRRLSPHGPEWREACRDLGIPGEARTHQLPFEGRRMRRRYRLHCPACGENHERVRPPRRSVACLSCCRRHHGGRYHERFRLKLSKIEANESSLRKEVADDLRAPRGGHQGVSEGL